MSSSIVHTITFCMLSAGFAAALAAGCSDDAKGGASDAGAEDATPDANRPKPPETDAATKSCKEQCEEAHPTALPKDEAINSCLETHCLGPCIDQTPDDGGAPDAGGTCVSPVVTVSESCDRCNSTFCCAEWDACFQDPECAALNACYQTCTD